MALPSYNNKKKEQTIRDRQEKEKESLLEHLRKNPIIQLACERTGISRMTYYRWRDEDAEFARLADEASAEADGRINDLAEAQLVEQIKQGKWAAIRYRLEKRHPKYMPRKPGEAPSEPLRVVIVDDYTEIKKDDVDK